MTIKAKVNIQKQFTLAEHVSHYGMASKGNYIILIMYDE